LACLISGQTGCAKRLAPVPAAYAGAAETMRDAGLREEGAFALLTRITGVGPRLTGSPEAGAAVELGLKMMNELGFENVHAEPVTVTKWVRGEREEAEILGDPPQGDVPLHVCALGGSDGTPAGGVTAPVVEVRSFEELDRLGPAARGKIVFFDRPMDRTSTDAFAAYGRAADQRVRGAVEAARRGAVAALVRSLTFRIDDFPHTGLTTYEPGVARIPAAAVSTADAERLSGLLAKGGPVRVRLKMSCRTVGPVPSANVVGEIVGSERPHDIVLVGGHLDSWDLAVGAHDDGAGCAASLEALRLIRAAGLRPKRTVRAVLFMDEEFGGTGGRFYAAAAARAGETHLVAMESDRGAFVPVAIAAGAPDGRVLRRLRAWGALFEPLGLRMFVPGGGGVDVGPLVRNGAVPVAVIPAAQAYFDVHHSALDVLGSVQPRDLEFQAVAMAVLAYVLAEEGV
jgi:hypothetical protein